MEGTSKVESKDMAAAVDSYMRTCSSRRKIFERRWYDNNFFDDGFHYRYLSRTSNKIVDLSERSTIYTPQRSIPKSSRQIRGITNLLMSTDPTPTVYPDHLDQKKYPDPKIWAGVQEAAKKIAQYRGKWLLNEWKKDDGSGETILDKVAVMTLLTMKHHVSFLEIWPDEYDEAIRSQVYDAFDIYLLGDLTSIYEEPGIVKAIPTLIAQIKSNPLFDKEQLQQITPDNRKASSEIKEAYMLSRYGRDTASDQSASLILKEAFFKEYVGDDNRERIRSQENGEKLLKKHTEGEPIIRQTFVAGGITLKDRYTNLSEYPFVDYRMEGGPIYGVPLIERFMGANKSLDSIVSRVERYTHTMVTGMWLKRRGEQFKMNNVAGGQVVEYDTIPPEQAQIAPLPPFVFEFIGLLTNFIEEQGVSTTTLGKLPSGIKSNAAIESLKESEYANLIIASRRLNSMMKRLAMKCLEIADEYYVTPKDINLKEKGDMLHFSVIGAAAAKARKALKIETPENLVTLKKDSIVDIEIEQGMAYTKEGQKGTMQEVMNTMIEMLKVNALPPQALQSVVQKYLEVYQFGSTEEFMDGLDEAYAQGTSGLNDQQLMMVKQAVLEALKDADEVGPKADETKVEAAKLGTLQAMKESGLVDHIQAAGGAANREPVKESVSIAYKDAPEDVKRQMEAQAGFQPSNQVSPVATDQALEHARIMADQVSKQQAILAKTQRQE